MSSLNILLRYIRGVEPPAGRDRSGGWVAQPPTKSDFLSLIKRLWSKGPHRWSYFIRVRFRVSGLLNNFQKRIKNQKFSSPHSKQKIVGVISHDEVHQKKEVEKS